MKLIESLILVGLICAAAANLEGFTDPPPTINQQFVRFFHNERVNYTCGWPDADIPPFEPYTITDYQMILESNSEFTTVDVTVENADVTLLHNMCFTDFNFSLMGRGIRMVIDFDRLNINGRHSTKTMTIGGRPVDGAGPMNIDLFDMEVTATALFDFIEPNSRMNITSISSTTRVTRATANLQGFGGVADASISRLVSAAIPGLVANNQELINEKVNEILIPSMNALFNQHNFNSLISLMASRNQFPGVPCAGAPVPRTCPFQG